MKYTDQYTIQDGIVYIMRYAAQSINNHRRVNMKQFVNLIAAVSITTLVGCATADTNIAKTLSVTERMTIAAPADKVWSKVSNFGDLGAWHPAVAKTEIIGGTNNQKGAVRLLTLGDGGQIKETLTAYDAASKTYSYVINEGVLPVSNYASTITVSPAGDQTQVVWQGDFKRKDTGMTPAEGQDDLAALNTIQAVYKAGLDNLKKISE